jgi:hypothetical protein
MIDHAVFWCALIWGYDDIITGALNGSSLFAAIHFDD